jgi:hypothetical protein
MRFLGNGAEVNIKSSKYNRVRTRKGTESFKTNEAEKNTVLPSLV